jgi:uncharacterized membrane protein HdeD (DUF308 family)
MAPATPPPGPDTAGQAVWKPFIARAVLSALFGLTTIFWREPSTLVMSLVGGLYLLALGGTYLWTHRMTQWGPASRLLTDIGGGLLLGAGVASVVFIDERSFAFAGAVALVVAGIAELFRGLSTRRQAAGRDLVVVGGVSIVTGGVLPFVGQLGAHALLGVTGGGALLTAVVLGIAALTYRHDSALSAQHTSSAPASPDRVN